MATTHYRSVVDLHATVRDNLHRLPRDIDLVVGVPRSGLLPGVLVSLLLNLPLTDPDGYLVGRLLAAGRTKPGDTLDVTVDTARHVLVIDDSSLTGWAMREVRKLLLPGARPGVRFTFCAVYGTTRNHVADLVLEAVPEPRVFQWNLMHHKILGSACVDIDGVLCLDPTVEQNDDGPRYAQFLDSAQPFERPTRPIGTLVTSRLEKYRAQTESWLEDQGIRYGRLEMLDLPDAETRRAQNAHATFKAEVYHRSPATLFIESECAQAVEIARISGKDVLCVAEQRVHRPGALSPRAAVASARQAHPIRKVRRWVRKFGARRRQHLIPRTWLRARFGNR